jgi:hypothetical protein
MVSHLFEPRGMPPMISHGLVFDGALLTAIRGRSSEPTGTRGARRMAAAPAVRELTDGRDLCAPRRVTLHRSLMRAARRAAPGLAVRSCPGRRELAIETAWPKLRGSRGERRTRQAGVPVVPSRFENMSTIDFRFRLNVAAIGGDLPRAG